MEAESKDLSPEESLTLISSMIRQAQGKVRKNSFFFLLWGWVIVIANLGMYILTHIDYAYPYAIWLITIPAWIFSMYKAYSNRKGHEGTSTHFDVVSAWLWISFGVVIFTLVAFGWKINYELNPVILIITSLPTLVSGIILRFKPLMFGGFAFWALGMICFLVSQEIQPLVGAVAIILGYLVPGYLLRSSGQNA